jgi:ribosomal protein S18 acetylase RimI-like enzyme
MVYEYGVMVNPDVRRKGIASSLQREIEARTSSSDYMHLNITEGNIASHSFFKGYGFEPVKKCVPLMVMAYKEHQVEDLKIRKMREGDIPVVVNLLNETYRGYDFYEPFTEDSFMEHYGRLPFYNLKDIYLFEQDTVLAVAGVWDYDKVMKFTLLKFNNRWKMMRLMTKVMGLLTAMPKISGVGEQMSNWYLTPLGYRDPDAASQLVGYLLNLAYKRNVGMISLPLAVDSPIKEVLSGYRYGEGSLIWYMKSISGEELPDVSSKPLFVDVKDI